MRSIHPVPIPSRRTAAALAVAFLITIMGQGWAADHVEAVDRSALRVCADPSSLPFSDEMQRGFENKIADLLARDLKVPVRYTWYPDSTGFLRNTLDARRCDLVMGIVSGAELVLNTNPYYRSSYVIVDGWAAVSVSGTAIAAVGPGDHVGEMALLDNQPRSATVTAKSPMRVLEIGPAAMSRFLHHPEVLRAIAVGLAGRVRQADTGAGRTVSDQT